jgi:elongation factor P
MTFHISTVEFAQLGGIWYTSNKFTTIKESEKNMGEVIGAGELHKGVKLLIDGEPWEITEFDFSKPGKGQAIYNCKLRNMMTGGGMTKSYRSGDKFEKPELLQMSVTYSYDDGQAFVFTDDNFEEIRVSYDVMGDKKYFLMDEMEVKALFFNEKVIGVDLPQLVERKVIKVEPGVKGNTASGKVTKPATVEGGYELAVPLFINEGDVIRINTESGEYNDRTATK